MEPASVGCPDLVQSFECGIPVGEYAVRRTRTVKPRSWWYRRSRSPPDDSDAAVGEHPHMYASEIRAHLTRLQLERIEADAVGLTSCEAYMTDLEDEISVCRAAYVGAAVTEIAVARGELSGRQIG
jgi:hypothetical protein